MDIGIVRSLMRRRAAFAWLGLIVLILAVAQPAKAAPAAAAFYQGKTVKLVVGYAPGGGFDGLARLLARYLGDRLGATVVVDNRPGGGGLLALNQVVRETPDGLTLMLLNGPAATLGQLLAIEGVRFDLLKVPLVGRVAADPSVVLVSDGAPFKSLEEMRRAPRPVKWAAGGKTDSLADPAACLSEALGLKASIVIGYKGSKEAALSAMRGETDGIIPTASSAHEYIQGGKLVPLVVLDRQRTPYFPELPTIFEQAPLSPEQAWWIDFRSRIAAVGRVLVTTPETPAERVEYLAGVFGKLLSDPAVVADLKARGHFVEYAGPGELRELLDATLGALKGDRLEQVRAVVLDKYYQ